jgi:hypothetical protein
VHIYHDQPPTFPLAALAEAVRIDLPILGPCLPCSFFVLQLLLPLSRPIACARGPHPDPLKMNGTTPPTTAASAATQTTETVKMNGTSTTTTTTADAGAGLFGDELISPEVAKALPEGYKIRALRQSDFNAGFLDCLRVLTTVGDITEAEFAERFAWLTRQDGGYYILVIEDGGRVVGTGALIVERKLYVTAPLSSQDPPVHNGPNGARAGRVDSLDGGHWPTALSQLRN